MLLSCYPALLFYYVCLVHLFLVQIKENYSSPSQTATIVSNDTSTARTFQRTVSAQVHMSEC